ncbi:hypothetical protein [Vibrio barjaei]|uniref:hypothetical protein n=1 Tax=Vibrio barjaei TaxID=1676683 RepID=UPI002284B400|nr:hypothetical protein [Vibrio barjaei]MCY9873844.1 hypothetical protein [Vibrio barjaei]
MQVAGLCFPIVSKGSPEDLEVKLSDLVLGCLKVTFKNCVTRVDRDALGYIRYEVNDFRHLLKIALTLKALVRSETKRADLRQSLGVTSSLLNKNMGVESQLFTQMEKNIYKQKRDNITLVTPNSNISERFSITLRFIDAFMSTYTVTVAKVMYCYLTSPTRRYEPIAKRADLGKQSLSKFLVSGRHVLIDDAIEEFNSSVKLSSLVTKYL